MASHAQIGLMDWAQTQTLSAMPFFHSHMVAIAKEVRFPSLKIQMGKNDPIFLVVLPAIQATDFFGQELKWSF